MLQGKFGKETLKAIFESVRDRFGRIRTEKILQLETEQLRHLVAQCRAYDNEANAFVNDEMEKKPYALPEAFFSEGWSGEGK